ncbi:MAG: NADH-quinone oxidoreductase subunit I [Deltaproteobacteria bacterium]|nr:MAG: NADH-quinone oxidoreductase subunit I [Deltaproteobacteria bacterium]
MPRVVADSHRNPKVRTVAVDRPAPERATFLRASLQGLGVTVKHFFRNVTTQRDVETIQYPEEKRPYPPRHRGLHRLMKRPDGRVRCVACMCCPTVCPAHCITIVPAETDDPTVEKYPAVFEIDELRCVVCGLCEEACPCDAIRMDSGLHAPPVEFRGDAIETKESMLARGDVSTATQGGVGPDWREVGPLGPRRD